MKVVPGRVLQPAQRIFQVAVFDEVGYVRVAGGSQSLNSVLASQHEQGQRRFRSKRNAPAVEKAQKLAEDQLTFFCFFQFKLLFITIKY